MLPAPGIRPLPRPRPDRLRWIGRVATVLMVALIARGTLVPLKVSPFDEAPPWQWCLVCGAMGTADVLQNVALFAPLGAALVLAGLRPRRAALAALVLSASIELVQSVALPGRFATLSDVVTNTLGGSLGALLAATWPVWAAPSPAAARTLARWAAAAWLAVLGGSAYALGRSPGAGPSPAVAPSGAGVPDMGWFAGRIRAARFEGRDFPHTGTGPVVVETATPAALEGAVAVRGSDPRIYPVPLLFVSRPDRRRPELMLAQWAHGAAVRAGLRSAALRLRTPTLRLDGAFDPASVAAGETRVIAGGFRHGTLWLSASVEGAPPSAARVRTLPLRHTLGWALVLPFIRVDGPLAPGVTALWLAALALPLGFWCAIGHGDRPLRLLGRLAAIVGLGLVAVPALADAPAAVALDWVATLAGLAVAAGAALAVARRARRASAEVAVARGTGQAPAA